MFKINLIFAYAEWCGPCKIMLPFFEEIRNKYGYIIEEIDVDRSLDVAEDLGIQGVPTILFYKDDELTETLRGYKTVDDILKKIKEIESTGDACEEFEIKD